MKMKTFAMLAASGLMAASIAYVLPAFAEDSVNDIDGSAPMQLAMGDDAPADNNTPDANSGATDSSGNSNTSSNNMDNSSGTAPASPSAANNTGATSDQPAQGDDDY